MPRLALATLACLAGCIAPPLNEPKLQVAPYLTEYRLRGKTAMDTDTGGGFVHHDAQSLSDFGVGSHEDDVGIRADIGDRFAGLRVDYWRMSASTSRQGILDDGWGRLQSGDHARMSTVMDEFRVSYAHEILHPKFDLGRFQDVEFLLAPAIVVAHRSMKLHGFEAGRTRAQNLTASDAGIVYPGARSRLQWQNIALDVEYAISPSGFNFGGDFHGVQQDFETRISYAFEMHDIEVFAGYRRSLFSVNGFEDRQNYTGDFVLDGFQFGVRFGF